MTMSEPLDKECDKDCAAAAEYDAIMMRQGAILRRVADALNGPPGPLRSWSHHDLGERAEAAVAAHRALISQLRSVLRLLSPDDITPFGVRAIEKILDFDEAKLPLADSGN